ncbi:MAG: hypothetical protein JSS43_08635 [Proteobacteria bacterium]|nr:hypothetical protein [Pseudomonadota bacterium]
MQEEQFQTIISTVAEKVFRKPSLSYNRALVFREIPGFDSILAIQYILSIEAAFNISLNEEEVDNMHTMGDLLALVLAKKHPG